jgi:hypothetical protein
VLLQRQQSRINESRVSRLANQSLTDLQRQLDTVDMSQGHGYGTREDILNRIQDIEDRHASSLRQEHLRIQRAQRVVQESSSEEDDIDVVSPREARQRERLVNNRRA